MGEPEEPVDPEPAKPKWGAARYLLWIDVETTGLDPENDQLLEVALAVTGPLPNLQHYASWSRVLSLPQEYEGDIFEAHMDNGLYEEAIESELGWTEFRHMALGWVQGAVRYGDWKPSPMCGASVHFDRRFIETRDRGLDWSERLFTYRNLDVSSLREFATPLLGAGLIADAIAKDPIMNAPSEHRAASDLRKSIAIARLVAQLFNGHIRKET